MVVREVRPRCKSGPYQEGGWCIPVSMLRHDYPRRSLFDNALATLVFYKVLYIERTLQAKRCHGH